MWRGLQGGYPDPPQKIFEQPETPVKKDHPHVARLTTGQSQLIAFLLLHDLAERLPGREAGPATEMPMPILDEITQPDPAGMGEVLNRNDYHTLDAKDHDGSMSHLGHLLRTYSGPMARQGVPLVESAAGLSPFYAQDIPARSD